MHVEGTPTSDRAGCLFAGVAFVLVALCLLFPPFVFLVIAGALVGLIVCGLQALLKGSE